jgi:PIN domain nuclease of toxin-antitoxin system
MVMGPCSISRLRTTARKVRRNNSWGELPLRHSDPFDRLLGAQAIIENADLVTADPAFRSFEGLNIVW